MSTSDKQVIIFFMFGNSQKRNNAMEKFPIANRFRSVVNLSSVRDTRDCSKGEYDVPCDVRLPKKKFLGGYGKEIETTVNSSAVIIIVL